jgi:acetyltransferase-like isoleucine patch superfamily enzyme
VSARRESPPAPTWASGDRHLPSSIGRGLRALADLGRRWIVHRGNKVSYLRSLGARIGRDTAILNDVRGFGTEPWLVEIGDRVTITAGVVFLTHDGSSRVFRHKVPGGSAFGNLFGRVRVLDNSFVGVNAILLPGVTIGPNSIVGAGSVVTHDVAPETVAAGVPARALCHLDEYVDRYLARMIPGLSSDRAELREQLEARLMETRP